MPFKKGAPRPPGAGRRKGSPNRATSDLLSLIQAHVAEKCGVENYHPVTALAEIANTEAHPIEVRTKAHTEVAGYVAAKRKAVEISGPEGGPIEHKIDMVDRIISSLEKAARREVK